MASTFDIIIRLVSSAFALHSGMEPKSPDSGVVIEALPGGSAYRAHLSHGAKSFTVEYAGVIDHPLESVGAEQARGFRQTSGAAWQSKKIFSGKSLARAGRNSPAFGS